ncbi:MAG TPA: bifunctional adenosylcobinamide kinase/adenosylcobinamide-phosphate guanylyltransferase [Gaiellales bacterium]|jgi:adenosyl cobinamide kinase/adenosyl cobinamide phosphate guanylyltransferase|nr:bifunctional adenosylcobinamide kinase/adenosylcobinamide-phosphate guanylyltransferase [Gaiellales bacterium]
MALTFVTGGARSGKSGYALRLAAAAGRPVVLIATAEARDDEMRERIGAHRRERPADWRTIEEPLDLAGALGGLADGEFAVVDCLSLWVSNLLEAERDGSAIEQLATEAAALAARRAGGCVAVSNEVGMGIVPMGALVRAYRDVIGRVNAIWAEAADDALFVVAGRVLRLERA